MPHAVVFPESAELMKTNQNIYTLVTSLESESFHFNPLINTRHSVLVYKREELSLQKAAIELKQHK